MFMWMCQRCWKSAKWGSKTWFSVAALVPCCFRHTLTPGSHLDFMTRCNNQPPVKFKIHFFQLNCFLASFIMNIFFIVGSHWPWVSCVRRDEENMFRMEFYKGDWIPKTAFMPNRYEADRKLWVVHISTGVRDHEEREVQLKNQSELA